MKNIARRLYPLADTNKIIHVDSILNPALRRIATDRKINGKIRTALSSIDPQLELLIPHQVDDPEKQLKRFIQYKLGVTVNLSTLRDEYNNYYNRMQKYGSPRELIEKWGLEVTYDHTITLESALGSLAKFAIGGQVRGLAKKDGRLYRTLHYLAGKQGQTVQEFVESLGYVYGEEE